jgi:hypothetical protein
VQPIESGLDDDAQDMIKELMASFYQEVKEKQRGGKGNAKAFQHGLRFSQNGYLARVVYTLPGLGHILKENGNFPVHQANMIKHRFYDNLTGCDLAVRLAEITQGSLKFQYVLKRARYIVFSKKSKLVVLTKFPVIAAVLFLVSSPLICFPPTRYQLTCPQYLKHEAPDLCVELVHSQTKERHAALSQFQSRDMTLGTMATARGSYEECRDALQSVPAVARWHDGSPVGPQPLTMRGKSDLYNAFALFPGVNFLGSPIQYDMDLAPCKLQAH